MSTKVSTDPLTNFIYQVIEQDISQANTTVTTRFPPEPNGHLHIGHAKAIVLNFDIAKRYNGTCNLRFDDTNPEKEETKYIQSIQEDITWLGYQWDKLHFASDYFEQLYCYGEQLIEQGKAYIDDLDPKIIRKTRGTLTEPGIESPNRNRPIAENLDLFRRMRNGEFADGQLVLRGKIDMDSPNLNMRDPVLYRIKHTAHHQTGNRWCIYPMYDYTHCLSDAIEGITHSLCTMEFADHRPLYDWILHTLQTPCHPQQIEFARLQLEYAITSKRQLNQLVEEKIVSGWDDPRLPTLSGMRRRGYPAPAIRHFCRQIGVTKKASTIGMEVLENSVREYLNNQAPRRLAVLRPLKVVIENYPKDQEEQLMAVNHPKNPQLGQRPISFSREIYIEHDDFMENAPAKFFRLSIDTEVRLRFAYYITCTQVIKDEQGHIIELRCCYDPNTRGGRSADGRKVKGTIHWVSCQQALSAEVHLYDRLFQSPTPWTADNFLNELNPNSLIQLKNCQLEAGLETAQTDDYFQFERLGYFKRAEQNDQTPVFTQIISLRDSWKK